MRQIILISVIGFIGMIILILGLNIIIGIMPPIKIKVSICGC